MMIIDGPARLSGELSVQGAKNSTLPLLAGALLCKGQTVLHNCPDLSDVDTAIEILLSLIHISEPTRLLGSSYAVFCLIK